MEWLIPWGGSLEGQTAVRFVGDTLHLILLNSLSRRLGFGSVAYFFGESFCGEILILTRDTNLHHLMRDQKTSTNSFSVVKQGIEMSKELLPYQLIDGNILNSEGNIIPRLAIAFDAENGAIFKHGQAQHVEDWATATRRTYANAGLSEYADALTVITFDTTSQLTVDTANKAILHAGWLLREWTNLQDGTPSQPKQLDGFA